jgi:hypothetical protein
LLLQKIDNNIGFYQFKANFVAENSQKIAGNCENNIDPCHPDPE